MSNKPPRRYNLISLFGDRLVLGILLGAFLAAAAFSSYAHFRAEGAWVDWGWLDSFAQNAGTEMLGAFITFLLIEVLVTRRRVGEEESKRRKEKEQENIVSSETHKQALIRQMKSKVHSEAIRAVEELQALGLLEDDSLRNANLAGVNLEGANLSDVVMHGANLRLANLRRANLRFARLAGVDLESANLESADLGGGFLRGAYLRNANLQQAILLTADLQGARFYRANLKGADLTGAKLQDADYLNNAIFDEDTILPDKTNWTSQTNFERFTNPDYPDFWRWDTPDLPSIRSNE